MRRAIVNANPERVHEDLRYVLRITGDTPEGKAQLENFIHPAERYPVVATTRKLMTTGVDAQTCNDVVLRQRIQSMTEFNDRGVDLPGSSGIHHLSERDHSNGSVYFRSTGSEKMSPL